MKHKDEMNERLNLLLKDELRNVCQYLLQADICNAWGYIQLRDAIRLQADDSIGHASKLVSRILAIDAVPVPGTIHINVGKSIDEQIHADSANEKKAILIYNDTIRLALEEGDTATADVLREILPESKRHLEWMEALSEQNSDLQLQLCKAMQSK
jgi:bacterioferritin